MNYRIIENTSYINEALQGKKPAWYFTVAQAHNSQPNTVQLFELADEIERWLTETFGAPRFKHTPMTIISNKNIWARHSMLGFMFTDIKAATAFKLKYA